MADFTIEGQVQTDQAGEAARGLKLQAFAFDPGGRFLGSGDVDPKGNFKLDVKLGRPTPVDVVVAPPADPDVIRRSSAPRQSFVAKDWITEGDRFRLKPSIALTPAVINLFLPVHICVSGHVRKTVTVNGQTSYCPVPFAKVEVFDVDREPCWWPYILRQLDKVVDKQVVQAADLLKTSGLAPRPVTAAQLPQLKPQEVAFKPADLSAATSDAVRVGEVKSLGESISSRLQDLTLVSVLPPWIYFPNCFFSRALVCETHTDCDGYFNCCFPWWLFHFRRGRLRLDGRPDIIIRVTQVINGVETVIYMDPYTSTRWNVTSTHIDLYLDNPAIVCGGCTTNPLPGTSTAAVLQIGSDPVWLVDQSTGKFKTPPYSNGAYGGGLYIRGNFSNDLLSGSPKRYYKLSYAKAGTNDFRPVQTPLSALRSVPLGSFETYPLGPQPAGTPVAGLYEVQDTAHWWLMPGTPGGSGMVLGLWDTAAFEADEGAYVLRMEVFDEAGHKITTMQFANHGGNGSGVDPSPVPIVNDHLDLKFHIDNKPVNFNLLTPATNACGVVPWSPTLTLQVHVHADQENGRVHSWDLRYVKGTDPTRIYLGSGEYSGGTANVDEDVDANALLHEPVTPANPSGQLQSTCAFALILNAWSHVRNNWGFAYVGEKTYAIAIEKCG